MLFNSFIFIAIFLPLTLTSFWCWPSERGKRVILLGSSLVYFGYFHWPYLALLIGLVGVAWGCALWAERTRSAKPVWLAGIILLGVLIFFKYAGFLVQVADDLGISSAESRRVHELALPIGLSFIVFQALGYVIDVYRREFPAEPRFTVVLLFKAFFPQLIAGPICRAHELIPQLRKKFSFDLSQFLSGLGIFIVGLFLKEVFADGLAPLVDSLYQVDVQRSTLDAWAAALGFSGQIYADFWGYSTMAVGLARMFGVQIPVNFCLPYAATSLREFWRRWHITLSQWLRDYLYKPLGGSRHGPRKTAFALMATMLLGGIWHGANYTFLVWGALHGLVLTFEHFLQPRTPNNASRRFLLGKVLGWMYTSIVVLVAWVFFRAVDVQQAISIVSEMFAGGIKVVMSASVKQIFFLAALLFVLQFPLERLLVALREGRVSHAAVVTLSFWGVIASIVLGAPAAVPFIYFQF